VTSSIWPGWLALILNLVGAAFVGWSIAGSHTADRPVWVLVVGLLAVLAWVARSVCALLGARRAALVLAVLSALGGALATPATDGVAVVPVAISVLALVGDVRRPLALGLGTAAVSALLIVVGALPFDTSVVAVLGALGGLLLALFAGISRRQFRRSEEQAALLRDREAAMREEAARVSLARDLHDVLAHSLGGLVVQLDAVDALLEAGEAEAARRRVVDARGLAVEGLAEARRAVAALRDPESAMAAGASAVDADAFSLALGDLLGAHRALGGDVALTVTGRPRALSAGQAAALQRALQEALSNARKHAPGAPADARLGWEDDRVTLLVSTPLPGPGVAGTGAADPGELAATGGGHGLEGMRERFAALPLGGSAAAEAVDGSFVVTAEAWLA
jgi:signal transduction histidine kinase